MNLHKFIEALNEIIKVTPHKPEHSTLDFLNSIKDQIELEFKEDGIRCIIFKDPTIGGYRTVSSSGSPLNGNFLNIIKELKPALDQGYVFSGEIFDTDNPDDRGASVSVAKNSKYPPERLLFITWNMFKLTPEMLKKGEIKPDSGYETPNYREMRGSLLGMLRSLRPKQVKASKRFKIAPGMSVQDIFDIVAGQGGEGIVAKFKSGGRPMLKVKAMTQLFVLPLKKFNISDSAAYAGYVTSLDVQFPNGVAFTVGQGYNDNQKMALTTIMKKRNGDPSGLYVGTVGYKPAKPFEKGGKLSWSQFRFLSTDPEGKNKLVEEFVSKSSEFIEMVSDTEQYTAEIRDAYGDVESVTITPSVREVVNWYKEHGIDYEDVHYSEENKTFTYKREEE